jgi:hypothetical protein
VANFYSFEGKDESGRRAIKACKLMVKKGKTITVFESDQDIKSFEELFRSIAFPRRIDTAELLRTANTFSAAFRFILDDVEKRLFTIERYCFKSSIDDWMYIAGPGQL